MIFQVQLSKQADKDLRKVPNHITIALLRWISSVELEGLEEIRKVPGYHDEQLKGTRYGQRSIRLNRSYRAIYRILEDKTVEFVEVQEVNKHDY